MQSLNQRIKKYEEAYMKDYGFEKIMVWSRQKYISSLIRKLNPEKVLEIGCGYNQLFEVVADVASIKEWIIVEPADIFSSIAIEKFKCDDRVQVIQGFIEEVVPQFNITDIQLCICSGLLHEVREPEKVLHAASKVLQKNGILHVNVPNAMSFHRRLACEMRLISSPFQPSERNAALSQFHIFSMESICALIEKMGLKIEETGGYFIKPFTNVQMEEIINVVGDEVLEGLWHMGLKQPEIASEIFINVRLENVK